MRPQLHCDQQTSFSAHANRENYDQMLSYAGTELWRKASAAGGRCLETLICQGEVWYRRCRGCIWAPCWDDGFKFSLIFPLISSLIHPSINQTCFHGCVRLLCVHLLQTQTQTHTKWNIDKRRCEVIVQANRLICWQGGRLADCSVDLLLHCRIL